MNKEIENEGFMVYFIISFMLYYNQVLIDLYLDLISL